MTARAARRGSASTPSSASPARRSGSTSRCSRRPPQAMVEAGYQDFADRWNPILDVFDEVGVRFAHEVHPSRDRLRLLDDRAHARGDRPPRGVRPQLGPVATSSGRTSTRWRSSGTSRTGSTTSTARTRSSRSATAATAGSARTCPGPTRGAAGTSSPPVTATCRGRRCFRMLNTIGYDGPISVEWEDAGMDRLRRRPRGARVRPLARLRPAGGGVRRGVLLERIGPPTTCQSGCMAEHDHSDVHAERRQHPARRSASAPTRSRARTASPPSCSALEAGYRLLDTAVNYENETEVGEALRRSGSRARGGAGRQQAARPPPRVRRRRRLGARLARAARARLPRPAPHPLAQPERRTSTSRPGGPSSTSSASRDSSARSASPTSPRPTSTRIIDDTGVTPAVNQIELHPRFPQEEMRAVARAARHPHRGVEPDGQAQRAARGARRHRGRGRGSASRPGR